MVSFSMTTQKMKLFIKGFFSKCEFFTFTEEILMENFNFCVVNTGIGACLKMRKRRKKSCGMTIKCDLMDISDMST